MLLRDQRQCVTTAPSPQVPRRIVEEDGSFEGILGFSQGAEVAASFLLYQAPNVTFKFAVFIGGTPPYDVSALAVRKDVTPVKMHIRQESRSR